MLMSLVQNVMNVYPMKMTMIIMVILSIMYDNVIHYVWYPECQKCIWQWVENYVYVSNGEIMLNVKNIFVSRKICERYDNDMSNQRD